MKLHGDKGELEDAILRFAQSATSRDVSKGELPEYLYAAISKLFSDEDLKNQETIRQHGRLPYTDESAYENAPRDPFWEDDDGYDVLDDI